MIRTCIRITPSLLRHAYRTGRLAQGVLTGQRNQIKFHSTNSSSSSLNSTASSIFGSLVPSCSSCGIVLQSTDRKSPGFYLPPTDKANPKKKARSSDKIFEKYQLELSEEDRKLLLNELSTPVAPLPSAPSLKHPYLPESGPTKLDPNGIQCIRCRDVLYRRDIDLKEHPVFSNESILSNVGPLASVVHVVNAYDFPLSVNPLVFQYRDVNEIFVVVTKCDLLFATSSTSNRYGARFFRDYFGRKYGIPPQNIFVTSGKVDWNIRELINRLPVNAHFLGDVNSGKSTLITSLLYGDEKLLLKEKRRLQLTRERINSEKNEDLLINSSQPIIKPTFASKKRELKYETQFKALNGPGTSPMPAFTRGNIRFELPHSGNVVFDVPGFGVQDHGILKWLQPAEIKQVTKGVNIYKRGTHESKYVTVKSNQCTTVGGLFYLTIPENAMVQVRNCINAELMVFKDVERATEVCRSKDSNKAVSKQFIVNSDAALMENLVKYTIPPFYGTIDLVIKNVGYVNIKPVGGKSSTKPFTVYLPQGAEAVIRRPIMKYIAKTLLGRDKKGNPLKREHWITKGTKEVHPYTGEVFHSRLVRIPSNIEDAQLADFTRDYCNEMTNNLSSEETEIHPDKVLDHYWIEL